MTDATRSIDDIYPLLKPAGWEGVKDCVCERLAELDGAADAPWVTWGWDEPTHFRFLSTRELESLGATKKDVRAKALENLLLAKVTRHAIDVPVPGGGDLRMIAFGGMFSAEKILDRAFLVALQSELEAEKLLVACPRRTMLLVTKATTDRLAAAFALGVAGQFRRAESPPVSPAVFDVVDGGIVSVSANEAPSASSGSEPVEPREGKAEPERRPTERQTLRLTEHPMPASFIWGTVCLLVGLSAFFFDLGMAVLGLALGFIITAVSLIVFYLREDVQLTPIGLSMRRAPIRMLAWEEVESFAAHDYRTLLIELSETGRAHYPDLPRTHFEKCDLVVEANFNVDLKQTVGIMNASVNAHEKLRSLDGQSPMRPAALSKGHYRPDPTPPPKKPDVKADYEMAMVVKEADGRTRIELMVGGKESAAVAGGAQRFALSLAEKYRWDPEFGGKIRIVVVPTITPESEKLTKALDSAVAELERRFGEKKMANRRWLEHLDRLVSRCRNRRNQSLGLSYAG